jgi:uncharacterized protein YbjT (DUF2867 family)
MDISAAPAIVNRLARSIRRLVLLSSLAVRDSAEDETNPVAKLHRGIERLIEKSGVEWTFVRPGWFATNALMWWAPQIPVGRDRAMAVRCPPIGSNSRTGIAAVAVRALTEAGDHGVKYAVTGPESVTFADQVRIIGEVTGRPLRYEEISPLCTVPAHEELMAKGGQYAERYRTQAPGLPMTRIIPDRSTRGRLR